MFGRFSKSRHPTFISQATISHYSRYRTSIPLLKLDHRTAAKQTNDMSENQRPGTTAANPSETNSNPNDPPSELNEKEVNEKEVNEKEVNEKEVNEEEVEEKEVNEEDLIGEIKSHYGREYARKVSSLLDTVDYFDSNLRRALLRKLDSILDHSVTVMARNNWNKEKGRAEFKKMFYEVQRDEENMSEEEFRKQIVGSSKEDSKEVPESSESETE